MGAEAALVSPDGGELSPSGAGREASTAAAVSKIGMTIDCKFSSTPTMCRFLLPCDDIRGTSLQRCHTGRYGTGGTHRARGTCPSHHRPGSGREPADPGGVCPTSQGRRRRPCGLSGSHDACVRQLAAGHCRAPRRPLGSPCPRTRQGAGAGDRCRDVHARHPLGVRKSPRTEYPFGHRPGRRGQLRQDPP